MPQYQRIRATSSNDHWNEGTLSSPLFGFFIQGFDANPKTKPCLTMTEITSRMDIPDCVIQHPIIQALLEVANDLVSFTNVSIFAKVEIKHRNT